MQYLEHLYQQYQSNAKQLAPSWRHYFRLLEAIQLEVPHEQPAVLKFLQAALEQQQATPPSALQQQAMLQRVLAAELLEQYLHQHFPGAKRFSLEGCDSLLVAIDACLQQSKAYAIQEVVMAMTHRGRLNVLVNILGKRPAALFADFQPTLQQKQGDVKYHQGFSADVNIDGHPLHLSLMFNPSHLESIAPVALGSVAARAERLGSSVAQILPLIFHGDAAIAGQGIVMETLNMSQTRGYHVGGSIHIIINNQIGFTTSNPQDLRSSKCCSDIAKLIGAPVIHVDANYPDAVFVASCLALAYRQQYHADVLLNLIGYRRHGHNEADDPSITQPRLYQQLKQQATVGQLYSTALLASDVISDTSLQQYKQQYLNKLIAESNQSASYLHSSTPHNSIAPEWQPYLAQQLAPVPTQLAREQLQALARRRDTVPPGFQVHPMLSKLLTRHAQMTREQLAIDWGYAETLAYASLLQQGYHVRLTGQDVGRGTFAHRHVRWRDYQTEAEYVPLAQLGPQQGQFTVVDSLLSEAAVLAFEYGYSTHAPRTLTIWEAQFGDFANNAQVIIDQFICSGEAKWGRLSGLVLLLPHGYEGQGPEHSSARIERFLQLSASQNWQVCLPSTPAQMFHLLRLQMLRPARKPLVLFTPKSLLRHPAAVSTFNDLSNGSFAPTLLTTCTPEPQQIRRVLLCYGKLYYELLSAIQQAGHTHIALLRLEQFYPWPANAITEQLASLPNLTELFFCQEEPANQGAWPFVYTCLGHSLPLSYIGRPAAAAPAGGSYAWHQQEQTAIITAALATNANQP